jgi:hypothetical protein
MVLTEIEILNIVEKIDQELKTNTRIKFSFDKNWTNNFPKTAGVYCIFYQDQLFYFGQSANLKERMKEVKRTYNHSFRKKLGKYLFPNSLLIKGKFSDDLENSLNEEFKAKLSFTFKEVNFGRIEIENYLMQKNKGVLNSIGKRSKKNS